MKTKKGNAVGSTWAHGDSSSGSGPLISETLWGFGHQLMQGPWQPSCQNLVCD